MFYQKINVAQDQLISSSLSSSKEEQRQRQEYECNRRSYNCVDCLTPSETLYRQYTSSTTSVKLTRCCQCGNDVDPYVERELLLVGIDMALHRLNAHRHLLFNREPFATFGGGDLCNGDAGLGCTRKTVLKMVQFTLAASMLDAYLKYEAIRQRIISPRLDLAESEGDDNISLPFPTLVLFSFVEHSSLVIGTWLAASCAILYEGEGHNYSGTLKPCNDTQSRSIDGRSHRFSLPKIFTALTIPVAAKFAVIFVLIWENTSSVRSLGSALVMSSQWIAVHAVTEREAHMSQIRCRNEGNSRDGDGNGKDNANGSSIPSRFPDNDTRHQSARRRVSPSILSLIPSQLRYGTPLLAGLVLRTVASLCLTAAFLLYTSSSSVTWSNQCSGFYFEFNVNKDSVWSVCVT